MKNARWGMVAAVVLGVVVFSGCQMPFKCISRTQYDKFREAERINDDQATKISHLILENEGLEKALAAANRALSESSDMLLVLRRANERLEKDLAAKVAEVPDFKGVGGETIMTDEGPGLRFVGDVFFATGQATLTPEAEKIMKDVADLLADTTNKIRVCGYTDSQWTGVSQWKSNFELSGARALSVLNSLVKQGVPAERLSFAGYGEHGLLYKADGSEDKAKSRRVEIILLNDMALTVAPAVKPK